MTHAFPADVCQELSKLHTKAPQHSFSHTKRIVEGSLGAPLGDIFHFFNPAPVASGSIAQASLDDQTLPLSTPDDACCTEALGVLGQT